MDLPTGEQIIEWSKVDFDDLEWDEGGLDDVLIPRAQSEVELATGQTYAAMPTEFEVPAAQAIQMIVELNALRSQEDIIETAADFDLIQNFSVTGYSETRRSIDDAIKAAKMISPWPALHHLLWGLATPDKKDEWLDLWQGVNAPAFEVTEVDWSDGALADYLLWPGA